MRSRPWKTGYPSCHMPLVRSGQAQAVTASAPPTAHAPAGAQVHCAIAVLQLQDSKQVVKIGFLHGTQRAAPSNWRHCAVKMSVFHLALGEGKRKAGGKRAERWRRAGGREVGLWCSVLPSWDLLEEQIHVAGVEVEGLAAL